jgi:hypothetical protein
MLQVPQWLEILLLWIFKKPFKNQVSCDWFLEKCKYAVLVTLSFKHNLQVLPTNEVDEDEDCECEEEDSGVKL